MYDITSLDTFKVLTLAYILLVSWIDPIYIKFVDNSFIKIFWIGTVLSVLLLVDIVLGIVLGIAFIVTIVTLDNKNSKNSITPYPHNQSSYSKYSTYEKFTPPPPLYKVDNSNTKTVIQNNKVIKPQLNVTHDNTNIGQMENQAHIALQKYVVDDLLQKASDDAILPDNYDKFPNPLGLQYNIQGIEKDIVGFNYTS